MSLTYTPPGELGAKIPEFQLPGINSHGFSHKDLAPSKPALFMFICNHCPYVKAIEDRLMALAQEFKSEAQIIAICSNDPADYPEDSFANLKKRAEEKNYPFLYLQDPEQTAAKAFGAVCTPDFFLFDVHQQLAYRGRLDDSWKDPSQVSNQELKSALQKTLLGEPITEEQIPSMGCSIKWKEE